VCFIGSNCTLQKSSLLDGFVPSVIDSFAIIPNATALFGEFATVTGSQINSDGLFFDVEYRANGADAIVAQLDAGPDQTINGGDTLSLAGAFGDPQANDDFTAVIDWDDGSALEAGTVDQTANTVVGSHVYAASGTFNATVTITGADGTRAVDGFQVTVLNAPPDVDVDTASVTVNEGDTAGNTGTVSDPDGDPVTLTASVGTVTDNGDGTWGWSLNTTDGPDETQTVTITATDSHFAVSTTTFSLTVNNVAPSVAADNASVTVNEADTASNTGTHSDPGADTVALTTSIGTVTDNGDGTWSWSRDTTDGPDDSQTVTITATDSDGASNSTSFALTVNNVAPSVAADNAALAVNEGATASNTGTVSDPGADTVALSSSVGTVTDNGNGTWSWSFATADGPDDSQTVTITAIDSDGASNSTTFSLTVNNMAPTVARDNASVTVNEADTANNTGTHSDPGVDTVALSASVGTVTDNGDGTWSWSLSTTDGPDDSQTVTITATDSDGASSSTSFGLTVNNVAPSVAADNASVTVNEGDTATNTGTHSDPGVDTVALSASAGAVTDNGDGTWSWSLTTNDGPDNSQTVTITATDSDGASSSTSFGLTVNNVGPSVAADSAAVTVNEGDTAGNTGTLSDPGGDALTLSASVGTVTDNGDGTWSWSLNTTDGPDDSQTVTITATDSDGASSSTSFGLTVNNVAPSVAADSAAVTVNEADTANNTGTHSDPGDDTIALSASVGTVTDNGDGTWSWSLNTTDGPDDSQTVTITITATDSDGASSSTSFALTVNNVAPSVAADNAAVAANEGDTASNTGTLSDPGADTLTLSASAGTVTDNGDGTWSWSLDTTDGPDDTQTVTITATDSDGASNSTSFGLTVDNVAPSVAADNASVTVNEGDTASNTGTLSDPGADTLTLSASAGTATDNGDGTWSWSLDTSDGPDDSQTVTVTATDSDGTSSSTTFSLTVDNVAPSVAAGADQIVGDGDTVSVSASFTDPGLDSHTAVIDWGDSNIVPVNPANTPVTGSHVYAASGTFTVTVTDDDGLSGFDSLVVIVNTAGNNAPLINADNATATVDEGDTASNTGTVSDLDGDLVTLSASVGTVTDNGDGTWSWSLDTTDGPDESQTVTITATDSNSASSSTSFALTVDNVAPSIAADNAAVTVNEGDTASNTGTLSDPGADTLTLSASPGTVTDNGDGTWSWSLATTDGPDDSQTVTITATDSDGASNSTSFGLTVDNVAPSVAADNAAVTVNEGDTASNSGTLSDPGADTVALSASAGTVTDNGDGTWGWSLATTDGPDDSQTVTITATDSDGASNSTSFGLTVDNVAPSVAADNASVTVNEGDTASNSGTLSDPGADTVALSASAGTVTDNGDGTWSWSLATTDGPDDSQTVTITATDSDGASNSTSFGLTVDNVAPSVAADNASVTVNEGDTASNTGTLSDPGADTVALSASAGTVTDNGDGTWSWSLATTDGPDDSQTVTITGTDSDGASNSTSFGLTVNNVAPSVAAGADQAVNDGDTVSISATFTDPGTDTHTATIDWGDSTVDTINPATSPVTGSHVYAAGGSYTVTVTVTDDDGAPGSDTLLVNVSTAGNDAPLVDDDNALVTVDEGSTASNTGTVSDPDGDPVTLSASAGTVTDNGDGTWSWSLATADGPDDSQTVTITATDSNSASSSTTFNLAVNNVNPVITDLNVSATSTSLALPGDTVTLDGTFADEGLPDTHHMVIDWDDGTQTIINEGDLAIDQLNDLFGTDHVYATGGIFEITVTLYDDDGGSTSATTTALVTGARLTGGGILQIVGSNGPDSVQVQRRGSSQIRLVTDFAIPTRQSFALNDVTLIHMLLGDGNDTALVGRVTINSIIEGGPGADDIRGGRGLDLLIGGTGPDFIKGRPDGDILIAGTTSYDGNAPALYAIMDEWTNAAETYATRVDHILNGGGLNGGFTLNVANVFDDGDSDELKPGTGLDLLFYDVDGNNIVRTSNLLLEEVVVDVDTV
jgi:hypothetical protein